MTTAEKAEKLLEAEVTWRNFDIEVSPPVVQPVRVRVSNPRADWFYVNDVELGLCLFGIKSGAGTTLFQVSSPGSLIATMRLMTEEIEKAIQTQWSGAQAQELEA